MFAVFAGFYLLECFHWLPLSCVIFKSSLRAWSVSQPSSQLCAGGSGLAIAWPLPMLGDFVVAQPWLILPDENGVVLAEPHPQAGDRVAWADMQPVVEDKQLKLKPGVVVHTATKPAAIHLRDKLVAVRDAKSHHRKQLIAAWWDDSLNLPKARAAVRRYRIAARALRMSCVFAFLLCFIYLPFLFWFTGGGVRVLIGFVALLLLNAMIAFTWRSIHRRLHPASTQARWPQVLHLLLVPAHTIRAHDLFGADSLTGFHPLAAAGALLKPAELRAFVAPLWRRWKYCGESDPMRDSASLMLQRIEACIQRLGINLATLDEAPPQPPDAQSYCPQCHTQFNAAEATCDSCRGVKTLRW